MLRVADPDAEALGDCSDRGEACSQHSSVTRGERCQPASYCSQMQPGCCLFPACGRRDGCPRASVGMPLAQPQTAVVNCRFNQPHPTHSRHAAAGSDAL
jgi:hypothetical protein